MHRRIASMMRERELMPSSRRIRFIPLFPRLITWRQELRFAYEITGVEWSRYPRAHSDSVLLLPDSLQNYLPRRVLTKWNLTPRPLPEAEFFGKAPTWAGRPTQRVAETISVRLLPRGSRPRRFSFMALLPDEDPSDTLSEAILGLDFLLQFNLRLTFSAQSLRATVDPASGRLTLSTARPCGLLRL
jgi:hypothetical protein